MRNGILRALDAFLGRPRLALALFGVLLVIAATALLRLRFDPASESFWDPTAEYYIDQKTLQEAFGDSGGEVIITLTTPDIFTAENLRLIRRLTGELERIEGVEKVISLATVNDVIGERDNFIVERLVKTVPEDAAGLAELKRRALSNPLYVKNVVSADGRTAGLLVKLGRAGKETEEESNRPGLLAEVRRVLAHETPAEVETQVSGSAAVDVDYMGFMQRDMNTFLPLAGALMVLALYFTFRRLRLMVMPLAVVGVSLALTMSLIHWFGFRINAITLIIPPVVMGVVIGDSIHYVLHALRERGGDAAGVLRATTRRMLLPCLMTSVTTAAGFLSLLTSRSPAMRQLGIVAAGGTLIACGVTFLLLPALLRLFGRLAAPGSDIKRREKVSGRGADWLDGLLNRLAGIYVRRYRVIVLAGAALGLLGGLGIRQIRVESSLLEQLPPGNPIRESTMRVEQTLTGTEMLYLSFKHPEADGFKEPANLRALERIQAAVAAVPGVDKVLSAVDFVKEMNQSFHNEDPGFLAVPDTRGLVAQYALLYGASDLEDYMDSGWSWAVMQVRVNEHVSSRLSELTGRIRERVVAGLPADVTVDLLGPVRTQVEGLDTLVQGQVWSLAVSFGMVFAFMFMAFRSVSAGWVSVAPNLLPLLLNFGIMGMAGIRLDVATSLISAIALGIIVDSTIHFVDGYRQHLGETGSHEEAMRRTLLAKGRAVVFTTLILGCSFGVLMFSSFVPIFQFGLLCTLLMFTAMLGDLVMMPCLALWVRPVFPRARPVEPVARRMGAKTVIMPGV